MNQKPHILIVDDDPRMVGTLADILEFQGYEITQSFSGPEALEKTKQTHFNCVLTDVKMPGMNGVELFQELRNVQPGVPVLLMTAYANDDLLKYGLESGVVGIIDKPINIHQLLDFLSSMGRGNVVTVVDDDRLFCETLGDILELKGFHVLKITDPHANVELMISPSQVILLDLKLNSISGLDIFVEIRKHDPVLPILLITHYRDEVEKLLRENKISDNFTLLYKPLEIPALLQILTEVQLKHLRRLL